MSQLRMIYRAAGKAFPAEPKLPDGYVIRPALLSDAAAYCDLREASGFLPRWDGVALANFRGCLIPDGMLLIVAPDGAPVASACAQIVTDVLWPHNGCLGWVLSEPAQRGRGLGKAVVAAAMRRLLSYGFRTIRLSTDDWRTPALAVYLKLGWQPLLTDDTHPARWDAVFSTLNIPPVPPAELPADAVHPA